MRLPLHVEHEGRGYVLDDSVERGISCEGCAERGQTSGAHIVPGTRRYRSGYGAVQWHPRCLLRAAGLQP